MTFLKESNVNYFAVLQLDFKLFFKKSENETAQIIKNAYLTIIDNNKSVMVEDWKDNDYELVKKAYNVLSHPISRKIYLTGLEHQDDAKENFYKILDISERREPSQAEVQKAYLSHIPVFSIPFFPSRGGLILTGIYLALRPFWKGPYEEAYEILSDSNYREIYNQALHVNNALKVTHEFRGNVQEQEQAYLVCHPST